LRLSDIIGIQLTEQETILLETINAVYIDARYPADLGLMPSGKPTLKEAENFIRFTETLFKKLKRTIMRDQDS